MKPDEEVVILCFASGLLYQTHAICFVVRLDVFCHMRKEPVKNVAGLPAHLLKEYGEEYFSKFNYADRPLDRWSMYWFARRYYAALVKRFGLPGGRVLELGCGLGHLLQLLERDFECTGIDIASFCIEQAKQNAPKATSIQMSTDGMTEFPSSSFDIVVALHLLEHLPDPKAALMQVHRVLGPKGILIFATPNPDYYLRFLKDRELDAIGKDPTHINVRGPHIWYDWLTTIGFDRLRHFGDGLWDVPYFPLIPAKVQFAIFGFPALLQVLTRGTWMPITMGVNQIGVFKKR